MGKKFSAEKHILVPKHSKLSEKEKTQLLENYQITLEELPKILKNDSVIRNLSVKVGDVIKIVRNNPVAGESIYYRGVVSG